MELHSHQTHAQSRGMFFVKLVVVACRVSTRRTISLNRKTSTGYARRKETSRTASKNNMVSTNSIIASPSITPKVRPNLLGIANRPALLTPTSRQNDEGRGHPGNSVHSYRSSPFPSSTPEASKSERRAFSAANQSTSGEPSGHPRCSQCW